MSLSIGQLASSAGLRASAIRYYESQGLLPRPSRRGLYRVYDSADLERVRVLSVARRLGFTITELKALRLIDAGGPARTAWGPAIAGKLAQLDRRLVELADIRGKLASIGDCNCTSPESCVLG